MKTASCGWHVEGTTLSDGALVGLTVYVFMDNYFGPKAFATTALKSSAR